jgi:anthranilate phosphoribosyltransferase
MLGTANLEQLRLYHSICQELGIGYTIVTSLDGYDEISLTSDFKVASNQLDKICSPADYNFPKVNPEELYGGSTKQEAAKIFDNVLENTATDAQKNVVLINAAFAIKSINADKSTTDCLAEARESLESGKALATLKKFVSLNS